VKLTMLLQLTVLPQLSSVKPPPPTVKEQTLKQATCGSHSHQWKLRSTRQWAMITHLLLKQML
jgi:hypothetical protein